MKAGVFIFISGFISAFLAAFIVSRSDAWDRLAQEFEDGKNAQLVEMDKLDGISTISSSSSSKVPSTLTSNVCDNEIRDGENGEELEDLDI